MLSVKVGISTKLPIGGNRLMRLRDAIPEASAMPRCTTSDTPSIDTTWCGAEVGGGTHDHNSD